MEKEFVPYQPSLELKELGFDEPCFGYRDGTGFIMIKEISHCVISAPTFSQAFRWFREKYNLYYSVEHYQNDKNILLYNIVIWSKDNEILHDKDEYKTYEEAELACLIKLIEIVKIKLGKNVPG